MIPIEVKNLTRLEREGKGRGALSPLLPETTSSTPWQAELARAVTDPAELISLLGLDAGILQAARAAAKLFPLRVPRGYIARMQRGDLQDPLLRQVMPLGRECETVEGYTADPVGDLGSAIAPGVLQKYHGRVLLTATGACAVHCRYCFRRHFPYNDSNAAAGNWKDALGYVERDTSIAEVILSGGDPFTMADRRLAEFVARLETIAHVRRLRIHTRLPIVLPERIDGALLQWFGATRLKTIVVVHANHANEIDARVAAACAVLNDAGATLFNQSVLLRGVNDSAEALAQLSDKLFDAGVTPYYLHLLDKVAGAAHFDVSDKEAKQLMAQLNARLPGYLVPRLVREVAGAPAKLGV